MGDKEGSEDKVASTPGSANEVAVKVAMVGDSEIGKTCLMVRYVNGVYDEMMPTLGVNFMEKKISLKSNRITFTIWDLGGQREFVNMLPIVCADAVALLFMFDLTRRATLISVKEWYRQARGFNKTAVPLLVGTKYDLFVQMSQDDQDAITKQAKMYSHAMKCPLIYTSASQGINVQNIFKIIISKAFGLGCTIPQCEDNGPLIMY